LLGDLFSVAFILIKAEFNRGITNPQQFEDIGLTVYATIPLSDTQVTFTEAQKLKAKISKSMGRKTKVEKENPTDSAIEACVPVYILPC
jgi:tyrosine-protein kinase Etk/Wzc